MWGDGACQKHTEGSRKLSQMTSNNDNPTVAQFQFTTPIFNAQSTTKNFIANSQLKIHNGGMDQPPPIRQLWSAEWRETLSRVGRNIRRLRQAQNLTQEILAKRSRIHADTLSEIERGGSTRTVTLVRIAKGLGVSVKTLVIQDRGPSHEELPEFWRKHL
jgi:ribosome-binding protein aMBF1 (putative translation factor)